MRKINLFLAGLTVFAFVACGNGETADAEANVETEVEVVEKDASAMEETVVEETTEVADSMATEVIEEVEMTTEEVVEGHEGHDHAEGEAH